MSILEMQIAAFMRLCTAEETQEREEIRAMIRRKLTQRHRPEQNIEREVRRIMSELEVPDNLVGHLYAVRAIIMAVETECPMERITSELFPKIADLFDTTVERIEYAMRHLVLVTIIYGNREFLEMYLGDPLFPERLDCLTAEFIDRLAAVVRQRLKAAA